MNPGDPTTRPGLRQHGWIRPRREMPKSITRGPSGDSSTFDGLRSRWITPAPWMAWERRGDPDRERLQIGAGQRPLLAYGLCQVRPLHVLRDEVGDRPSSIRIEHRSGEHAADPPRRRDLAAEPGPELRVRGQLARMAFTATGRPPGETPRNTRPMPPWPSCPTSRYGPIDCGSSGCSSLANAKTPTTYISRSDRSPYGADRTTINT